MSEHDPAAALRAALAAWIPSARLQAALAAGTHPDPRYIDVLVERCAIEPDFYVRDMLTWALLRQERAATLARVQRELHADAPQARSQALHTLSKLGEPSAWPAITPQHLLDADDEVARAAWRTAAGLAPAEEQAALAETLATQFGRGERDVQLSLTRAFAVLGPAGAPSVERATSHADTAVRRHALATERILQDPEEGFDSAFAAAERADTPPPE